MRSLLFILFILCFCPRTEAQDYFSIMAWNVENLFDTQHDEGKRDEEFLPEGDHRWTRYRFFKKLKEIGKTIVAVDSMKPVEVIGLCEVENDSVLICITERTPLRQLGYQYVMTHSADERGIDVALLYAPLRFHLIAHESLRTPTRQPVRDVLHATGSIPSGDTLDIYLLHLPSKLGGAQAETHRKAVVNQILTHTDSVSNARQHPNIIVMGDFNDEFSGKRMQPFQKRGFVDVIARQKPGTYKYQGQWSILDHILVKSPRLHYSAGISALPFLLEPDKTHQGQKPFRTYLGPRYNGGISDHLPIWMRIKM